MTPLTVSQITSAIKNKLETQFRDVCIQGEISNLKEQSSGHIYFTLKDESAQLSSVLFRGDAMKLQRALRAGDQVVAKGEISVYAPRGSYQLIVRDITYAGVGALLLKFHELKMKLEKLGWFDPKRKRALPKLPKTIGVITSPTGAVIQDILQVLKRRFPGFQLLLNPVKVQGDGAAADIAKAIQEMNHYALADVLIVARGGGSLEDLFAFNEEIVACAIYQSKIPVISAVGHETDFSIADMVADVRAPTPSAAAEIVLPDKGKEVALLLHTQKRAQQYLLARLQHYKQKLVYVMKSPHLHTPEKLLERFFQMHDEIQSELAMSCKSILQTKKHQLLSKEQRLRGLNPISQIQSHRMRLLQLSREFRNCIRKLPTGKREKLMALSAHLKAIDPRNLLRKGYSLLFSEKSASIIVSAKQLTAKDRVKIVLADGSVLAEVL